MNEQETQHNAETVARVNPNPGPSIFHDFHCTHDPCRCAERTDPNTCDHETVILVPSDEGLGFAEDGWLCAVCSTPFAPVQRPKLHFDYCTALHSGCCSCDPNEKDDAPLPDDPFAAGFMVPEPGQEAGDE